MMRIRLTLGLLLLAIPATAAPKPDLSLRRYLAHTDFIPRAAQGGMSNSPIVFQNQGVPLGVSFTVNCSTGMTCSFVSGVMTLTATGGGGFPRLDQVLDPTVDKTFAMGGFNLNFSNPTGNMDVSIIGNAPALIINSPTDIGAGQQGEIQFRHTVDLDWELSSNSEGNANYEFVLQELTNFTNKLFVKKGTTGDFYLNPSGGKVGIGVDPTGSPAAKLEVNGTLQGDSSISGVSYLTATNCSSAATPAACGSAAAGSVAVPTGITPTLVVNTTAVTANSQILFTPDESLGARLGVTCNSTIAQVAIEPIVTARTAATSFTIQYNTTITTNPICLSYLIIN